MKNSHKKILTLLSALAVCCMVTSCGEIEQGTDSNVTDKPVTDNSSVSVADSDESSDISASDDSSSTTETTVTTDETSSTSSASDNSDESSSLPEQTEIPDITGTYSETVNGNENGYLVISSQNSGEIFIGNSHTAVPMSITLTADTIAVNRGGVSDNDTAVNYNYSDGAITFTDSTGKEYVWTKIDFIPLHGTYYQVDDEGTYLSKIIFNGDGTGTKCEKADSTQGTDITYTQTSDAITITENNQSSSYTYTYDIQSLTLTKNGTTLNYLPDQSDDTNS